MKKILSVFCLLLTLLFTFPACESEAVKLDRDDRTMIDTLANRQIFAMAADLDKWCKDSTPVLRQRMVDSLMIVREQEILRQTPPPQY
jgi:hypothetical protein